MAKKKADLEAEKIAVVEIKPESETQFTQVIVFKATRPMDEGEFKLLSDMIRSEEEKAGIKIVLMPYSCEMVDNG